MVLYKRKQVNITLPSQIPEDLNTEVFYIPQTKEWFIDYEKYLARMDYYHRKKFVCEITGNSCLTFFEALASEIKEIKDVENNFPEALKVHILRFMQFSRVTRLDMLVDNVYSKFKTNYFPGEAVLLKGIENEIPLGELQTVKQKGQIREKVEMADKPTQYLVVRDSDNRQGIVTGEKISRDRNHFTKYLVKTFIKLTMTRSHKIGAPWVLKDRYAKKYNISQEYPSDLKQYQASTNTTHEADPTAIQHFLTNQPILGVNNQGNTTTTSGFNIDTVQNNINNHNNPDTNAPTYTGTFNVNTHKVIPVKKSRLPLPLPLQLSVNVDGTLAGTMIDMTGNTGYQPNNNGGMIYQENRSLTPNISNQPTSNETIDNSSRYFHRSHKKFNPHYLPFALRQRANYPEESVDADKPSASTVLSSAGISYAKRNMDTDLNIKFDLQTSRPIGKKLKLPVNAKKMNNKLLKQIQLKTVANLSENQSKDLKDEKSKDESVKTEEIEVESIASMSSDSEDDTNKVKASNVEPTIKEESKKDDFTIDQDNESDYEDLDVSLLTDDLLDLDKNTLIPSNLLKIGDALECWIFINIYHNVLKIDTFTFDDFLYVMGWNLDQYNESGRSELLDEIWCSILGAIVSNELPKGKNTEGSHKSDIFGLRITIPSEVSYLNQTKKIDDEALVDGSDSDNEVEGMKTLTSEGDGEDEESESEIDNKKLKNNKNLSSNGDSKHGSKSDPEIVEDEGEEADDEAGGDDEVDDEDDENSSNDLDDDESREHNAYQTMNHRGVPWHDRLRKRNFRDGNWQTIVLGVLSLIEHLDEYKEVIEKVYKILAPRNDPATASTALTQFYSKMDINLRFQILAILCRLLGTSDMIRDYIDLGIVESSKLRKDRLEIMKNERLAEEKARAFHEEITTIIVQSLKLQPDAEEFMRKKIRLNLHSPNTLTDDEKNLSLTNPDLSKLIEQRSEALVEYNKLNEEKKGVERKLAEFDCQRLRCLGKDRLYNRYWWFENNGVPTLHGNADDDDNNDDENLNDNDQSNEKQESDDEPLDETYLMGRLWVQGPAVEDIEQNLKSAEFCDYENDSVVNPIIKTPSMEHPRVKELNFNHLPSDFIKLANDKFGLKFKDHEIRKVEDDGSETILINGFGELTDNSIVSKLSPIERKLIEECPDPLFNGNNWRYFDKREDIENIIRWLNPYGTRESQLKKSLLAAKDAIINSIESRSKTLSNQERIDLQIKIKAQINQIEERLQNYTVSMEIEPTKSQTPTGDDDDDDDDITEIKNGRKRNLRTKSKPALTNKRVNYKKNFEETIKFGTKDELEDFKTNLQDKLDDISRPLEFIRVTEWVNSQALNEFGKSLYDAGDKFKPKSNKKDK